MQIMMLWDNMQYLRNMQHLLVIIVHISHILDQYIHLRQTLEERFQKLPTSRTPGMAHLCLMTCQLPTLFLLWMSIITVGNTILRLSLLPVVVLVLLISLQYHLPVKGQLGVVWKHPDRDLLCILFLLGTGTSSVIRKKKYVYASDSIARMSLDTLVFSL